MKVWMGAHSCGEHAGAVGFTGELAVGEFRSCRAVVPLRPLFSGPFCQPPLLRGSRSWAALFWAVCAHSRGPPNPIELAQ